MFKSESTKYYYIETENISGTPVLKIVCINKMTNDICTIWHSGRSSLYDLCKSIIVNRKNAILNLRHNDIRVRQLCELILRLNRNINRGNKKWKRFQQVRQN
jgi:hypothetical protein